MKNPGLPPDKQDRHHPDLKGDEDTSTTTEPLNVPKVIKKSAITWVVPAALGLICLGLVALSKAEVAEMLKDYQTKDQATVDRKDCQDRLDVYIKQISILQDTVNMMDKKIDHLTFTVEWMQAHQPRTGTPKDQP